MGDVVQIPSPEALHSVWSGMIEEHVNGDVSWDNLVTAWSDIGMSLGAWAGIPMPHLHTWLRIAPGYPVGMPQPSLIPSTDEIRELAYYLWQEAGCPEGVDDLMWEEANRWCDTIYLTQWRYNRRLRYTAYYLWNDAGRPDGRSEEFWQRAVEIHRHEQPVVPLTTFHRHVNSWTNSRGETITIYENGETGKSFFRIDKTHAKDRVGMLFVMMEVALTCWNVTSEEKALEKLRSLIDEDAYRQYVMTGSFVERSERSNLYYMFRKGYPTIVMKIRSDDTDSLLCALCMHPLGFYDGTWAGALPPTDDVIAHLLMMRYDEKTLWKKSTQHPMNTFLSGVG